MISQTFIKNTFLSINFLIGIFGYIPDSLAVTLDSFSYAKENFQGQSYRLDSGAVGQRVSLVQDFAGAYGGTRSVELTASHDGSSKFHAMFRWGASYSPSNISINNTYSSAGDVLLSYDGNTQAGIDNYSGLCSAGNCLNLYQGNGDGIVVSVWYDHAFSATLPLEFTFFDASDSTGNTYSRGTLLLDRPYTDARFTDLFLPFTSLNQFGSLGGANLSNIGAFSLAIQGAGKFAADFSLTNIRTNGSSTAPVPEPSTITLILAGALGISKRRKICSQARKLTEE